MSGVKKGGGEHTRKLDVSCRLYFMAEVPETLLEHGSGFLMHVLQEQAMRLLKEGKRSQDFHLTIMEVVPLKQQRLYEEGTIVEQQQLLTDFMHYLAAEPETNLVAEGSDTNNQIVSNFLARWKGEELPSSSSSQGE